MKTLIWKGKGTLLIGSRKFAEGDFVPVSIINPDSLISLKKKGALVDHNFDEIEDAEFTEINELSADQQKQYDELLVQLDGEIVTLESLEKEHSELTKTVLESLQLLGAETDASRNADTQMRKDYDAINNLVKTHSDNYENSENALKAITASRNKNTDILNKSEKKLTALNKKLKDVDQSELTEKQLKEQSDLTNAVDTANAGIKEADENIATENAKFNSSSELLVAAKKELEQLESDNEKMMSKNNLALGKSVEAHKLLESNLDDLNEKIEAQKQKIESLKNALSEIKES